MKRLLSFFILLFILSSCTAEIDQMINGMRSGAQSPKRVFFASTEGHDGPDTKTYADVNKKVRWNADDRVSIFVFSTYNEQYRFTGEDGATSGGFVSAEDDAPEGDELDYAFAVYPYN